MNIGADMFSGGQYPASEPLRNRITATDSDSPIVPEAKPFKPDDPVNSPKHYTSHPSGVACIEITRHMTFNLGNAVKYIWRADEKGNSIQDLEKAVWYLNDEITKRRTAEAK